MEEQSRLYFQHNVPLYDPVSDQPRFVGDLELFVHKGEVYWVWDSGCHETMHILRADWSAPLNCYQPSAVARAELRPPHIEGLIRDALILKSPYAIKRESAGLGKNEALVNGIVNELGLQTPKYCTDQPFLTVTADVNISNN